MRLLAWITAFTSRSINGLTSLSFLARLARPFMTSNKKGASTSVYLASSPEVTAITGEYFAKSKVKKISKLASDQANIDKMWQISMDICGLENYGQYE